MRNRLAQAAIVAVLGLATLSYGVLEKNVTVQIEGRPVAVHTFALTVGGALSRAGVSLGAHDRVDPPAGSSLGEGEVIKVFRAKQITLLLDGRPRRVLVTGLTIDEVLDEIALRGSLADVVHPSRGARVTAGMTISYHRAVYVTVRHDDRSERVVTNAGTVAAVIHELGIKMGAKDKLRPAATVAPKANMVIRVLRVGIRKEYKRIPVPFTTVTRKDRHLEFGLKRVAQSGRPGVRMFRYLTKYVDGNAVSRRLLGAVVVKAPKPRVISVGTSFPGCACDRGTQMGKGTWYSQADGLSAAHRTLPLGTVVRVENLANGRWVNVVIRDRGPFGDNRIIDLSDEAFRRIASLSTGVIRVRIRW